MASVASLRDLMEALIESAEEEGKLPAVIADLEGFFDFIRGEEILRKTLSTTAYDAYERRSVLSDVARSAGYDVLTANFLGLVVEHGKLRALLQSEQPLMRRLRRAAGVARAEVTLARKPEAEDLARIRDALQKHEHKDIEVTIVVDPKILGGVVAKVEDRLYDGSLRTQLGSIKNAISKLL